MSIPIEIKMIKSEQKEYFLNEGSDPGWYIDQDGDLIFLFDEYSRGNYIAFVIKNSQAACTTFLVHSDEIDDILYSPVEKVVSLNITAKAIPITGFDE